MAAVVRYAKRDTAERASAASSTKAEETNYTISWATLTGAGFANGDQVLVIGRQSISGAGANGTAGRGDWRVGSSFAGATTIEGSDYIIEPQTNISSAGHHHSWFDIITLATNDNIYFGHAGDDTNVGYSRDMSILLLKVGGTNGLTTDDYKFAEVTSDVTTAPTSYDTSGASVTVPGRASGNDWLLAASAQFLVDTVTEDVAMALSWDSVDYGEMIEETEDVLEIRAYTVWRYVTGVTADTTLRSRYRCEVSTTADIAVSRVLALRLSAFRDHAGVQGTTTITHTVVDTYQEFAGLPTYAHGGSGANDLIILAATTMGASGDTAKSPYGRVQIGGADALGSLGRNGGARNHGSGDKTPWMIFGIDSVSNGTLDIDADVAEDSDITPNPTHTYHTLVAFSAELETVVNLAGTCRGAGRITGSAATDVALAGYVRGAGRLLGAATTDVALAGSVRGAVGRLLGPNDITSVVADLAGTLRGAGRGALATGFVVASFAGPVRDGPGRLTGLLTTDVTPAGSIRAGPGRLLGSAATDVALAGTIRSGPGRLPGGAIDFTATTDLAGTLRGGPGRLLGAAGTDLALVGGTVRGAGRLVSAQFSTDANLAGTLRGAPGRLLTTEFVTAYRGGPVRAGPGRLTGAATTDVALAGVLRSGPGRLPGGAITFAGDANLAGTLRGTPGRLLGAATTDLAVPGGAVRSGSGRLTGALSVESANDVNLAGTLRGTPGRLLTTEFVTAYGAGPVRSGPGRFLGAGLTSEIALAPSPIRGTAGAILGPEITLEFEVGELRSSPGRLLGVPASDVALAGVVASLPGRLLGGGLDIELPGQPIRSGVGRLTGLLTAGELVADLAGTLRGLPGRLTGLLSLDYVGEVNLAGTVRGLPGRLLGTGATDVDLAGTTRSGAGRLTGSAATDVALAGTVRGAGRLLGTGATELALTGGTLRSGPGRFRGFLLLIFPSDVELAGVVRGAPGRVMFRAIVLGHEVATVRALLPRYGVDGTLEPRYLVVGIGGPRLTVE